ncbi:unnamed protein product, partial [Staurois parvus]
HIKGKHRLCPRFPLRIGNFVEQGYLKLTGTRSPLSQQSPRLSEVEVVLPPHCLLGHVTGPRSLQDHSQSAALLAHAQWAPGCEAASCHSRVPTLKMPGREDGW